MSFHFKQSRWAACGGRTIALAFLLLIAGRAWGEKIGPWDTDVLFRPPAVQWGEKLDGVQELFYEGEPYQGHASRVYAVFACPEGPGPFPAIVCVHGGEGTAFPEWVRLWAARGYAAISMDLAGCGPRRERLPDGGPDQSDDTKFRPFDENTVTDMWTYHAVAAVIRAHSLLRSLPQVDSERTGVTGISWGGYLTCIVAGVDHRFRVAIPVYGCGFLHENSVWLPRFNRMTPEQRDCWVELFDPSRYLNRVRCAIFFLNGTNDFAYPLDSYRKSYDLVPGDKLIRIEVRMKHSHPDGWNPSEIAYFADSILKGGIPLPRLGPIHREGRTVWCEVTSAVPLREAHLSYTQQTGVWQEREWHSVPAELKQGRVVAALPSEEPSAFYLDVVDERGVMTSTPPEIVR